MSESNEPSTKLTCDGCKHWRDVDVYTKKRHGVCCSTAVVDAAYGISPEGVAGVLVGCVPLLLCGPQFGCVHWEVKDGNERPDSVPPESGDVR